MSRHKVLASEGLNVLTEHLKRVRSAAVDAKTAADALDDAEKLLDTEIKGLIAELRTELEDLTNEIIITGTAT
ncbi:MAG: hypothetical protein E7201_00715 [Selenomonas ruminantium]|uniref:Uncharacterized protein n=1 Tax=Selenomonas ruminantium TaxID=971 RepID=A0A927WPP2_SELRU|nr:hypothetical protein [Selenomonas ruminantium]